MGYFIDGWLVGGDLLVGHGKGLLLGGVCEWHYGGGLFVTYNGNRWVRMIIVTYIYCAIFPRLRFFMDN